MPIQTRDFYTLHPKMADPFQLKRYLISFYTSFFFFLKSPHPFPFKNKLLDVFFHSQFQNILNRSDSNILNLLSCSAGSTYESFRKTIAKFAQQFVIFISCNVSLNLVKQPIISQNFMLFTTQISTVFHAYIFYGSSTSTFYL